MYQLTARPDVIQRVRDGAFILVGAAGADYADYVAWRRAGNEPAPYAEPDPGVPEDVSKRAATLALIMAGLDEQIDTMLDAMPGIEGKMARAEWRECYRVRRDSALLAQMAAAMGLTEAKLDELFVMAAGFE